MPLWAISSQKQYRLWGRKRRLAAYDRSLNPFWFSGGKG